MHFAVHLITKQHVLVEDPGERLAIELHLEPTVVAARAHVWLKILSECVRC